MPTSCRFILTLLFCIMAASAWADQKVYTLNSSYSPPHSTEDQTGYLDLILKEAFRRAGFGAEIQMMPAERCLRDANAGISDGRGNNYPDTGGHGLRRRPSH